MISQFVRIAAVGSALAAGVPAAVSPALAQSQFDGSWSVVIVTRSGACDPSYRFGVAIRGGVVSYQGGGAVAVSGRVSKSGAVSVSVSSGGQSASGSGRLSGNRGGGGWRGQGSQGTCSGSWSASRG
jgi:hypothetical protein